jgi:hypothetical protein
MIIIAALSTAANLGSFMVASSTTAKIAFALGAIAGFAAIHLLLIHPFISL